MQHHHPPSDTPLDDSDSAASWDAVLAAWRGPIRAVAGLGLLVALVVIVIRTLGERGSDPAEAYLGGLFLAAVAAGVSGALYALTASD